MIMLALFTALWTQDPGIYEAPMRKCAEVVYSTGDIKAATDKVIDSVKSTAGPIISPLAISAYTLGVRQDLRLSSSRLSPIPNTTAFLNANKQQAAISFLWRL